MSVRGPSSMGRDAVMAALAGVLIAVSLSGCDVFWLAWIAYIPLFIVVSTASPRRGLVCGGIAGLTQTVCMLYWIPPTIQNMGKSFGMGLVLLAVLCIIWSAGLATFCWLACLYQERMRGIDSAASGVLYIIGTACLWVTFEFAHTRLFSALPWLSFLAGYSQWNRPLLIQVASAGGVHGVSFAIIAVNLAIARTWVARNKQPLVVAAAVVACVLLVGICRLNADVPEGTVRVAVLQANLNPTERLNSERGEALARRYLRLTESANSAGAHLVVWTESAIPWPVRDGDDLVEEAVRITGPSHACHLIGAPVESPERKGTYLNSALLVSPDGRRTGLYSKLRPLVMAETTVCFPGTANGFKIHPSGDQFVRGTEHKVLNSPVGVLGVNICNENFHSDLLRESARQGADFLVNLTNDGWFRQNMPLRLHFLMNPFRAVETGRAMVVANSVGVSAIIDSRGRQQARAPIRTEACLVGEVAPESGQTLYTRYGDAFAYGCICWSVLTVKWRPFGGSTARRVT